MYLLKLERNLTLITLVKKKRKGILIVQIFLISIVATILVGCTQDYRLGHAEDQNIYNISYDYCLNQNGIYKEVSYKDQKFTCIIEYSDIEDFNLQAHGVITDAFNINFEIECIIAHGVITLEIYESIYLRFFTGLFSGATEYFGADYPIAEEFFIHYFLLNSSSFVEFCEFDHNYQAGHHRLVFVLNEDVRYFQYVELQFNTSEYGNYLVLGDTLFSIDLLQSNQPFVTTWISRGNYAPRGVSFTDRNNTTRVFSFDIQWSGISPHFFIHEIYSF